MTKLIRISLLTLSALYLSIFSISAHALKDGDTIRIIVPYSPGGGYDSQARLAAPFVEKEIQAAGMPNIKVIVENIRGGGGAIATAQVYASKPNGRTILFLDPESSIWQQALSGAPFEVDKFSFIGQMSIDPMVFMVRTNLGLNNFEAVVGRSQNTPILMGTSGKGGYDHIMPVIMQKMLNDSGHKIDFDYLHLDGTAPILASMKRGEVEASLEVISTFGGAEEAGEVEFMFDFIEENVPSGRWPDASKVTSIPSDKLALLSSAMNYRRVFVTSPGVDSNDLNILRNAFKKALNNEDLISKSIESRRPITYVPGVEIKKLVVNEAALAKQFTSIVKQQTQ
jgi:tripartite-type tricarboxylate transporter receptor subunit TctC